ncbi:MAG: DUF1961 family protein [Halanaerobiales bacterium]
MLNKNEKQQKYEENLQKEWEEVFFDECTDNWQDKWILDGKIAEVINSDRGMELKAGPEWGEDAHHAVLWTKDYFKGDLKIEYEYTRLDEENKGVNIIYIQATGEGEEPYTEDIMEWSDKREVPAMSKYFNHMHTYHISYAADPGKDNAYIRARRYTASGLADTDIKPDYDPDGLFKTGEKHKITIIKSNDRLFMNFAAETKELLCYWHNTEFPAIEEGYIGLRHMFTRSARYKNFKISRIK